MLAPLKLTERSLCPAQFKNFIGPNHPVIGIGSHLLANLYGPHAAAEASRKNSDDQD